MAALNLPPYDSKTKDENGLHSIYDTIRRKYVALTPEEWVRQHFVHYLINHKEVPRNRISNEIAVKLYNTTKRCDTVIYGPHSVPIAIVEYKSPDVEITQAVFEQICRYNMVLKVSCLIVSNGMNHYSCSIDYDTQSISFLPSVPSYAEMLEMAGI